MAVQHYDIAAAAVAHVGQVRVRGARHVVAGLRVPVIKIVLVEADGIGAGYVDPLLNQRGSFEPLLRRNEVQRAHEIVFAPTTPVAQLVVPFDNLLVRWANSRTCGCHLSLSLGSTPTNVLQRHLIAFHTSLAPGHALVRLWQPFGRQQRSQP